MSPSSIGEVRFDRRVRKCSIDRVGSREQLVEVLGTNGDHRRQPNRALHGVATADPVPELEHVRGVDAEGGDLFGVRRDRDEVLGDRRLVAEALDEPLARRCGVGQGLQGAKGLRGDDEERLFGVRSRTASTKSVASTLETKRNVIVALERSGEGPRRP